MFELTKKDVPYLWQQDHQAAFDATKKLTTAMPVLRYYDPRADLEVQCDASDTGIGATLMQEGQPIAYASRVLTPTEQHYAPIEKKMLAIAWAMEKYHQYTYGNLTTVYSDHKPLESIMVKALKDVPKRLQNMRIRLQHHNVKVEYKPGATQHVDDYLSRLHTAAKDNDPEVASVNEVSHVLIGESWREKLSDGTANDPVLQAVRGQIMAGWPEKCKQLPEAPKTYHAFHEELAFADGFIFRGERVIVPASLRKELMEEIHSAQMGVQSSLRRARECLYWPRMNAEITDYVSRCDVCQQYSTAQPCEPMMPLDVPDRPWQTISCDLFHWKNSEYLVTVDHFSNVFEVDKLSSSTTQQVTRKLSSHFARYGQPETLVSDNGAQFTSSGFSKFMARWDMEHRTSSPHHQQGNGRAEAAVKIAKNLMTKADADHQDPYKAFLVYRNTELEGLSSSPAQRFLGRRTRTGLPTTSSLLQPCLNAQARSNLHKRQEVTKEKYDRHAQPLQPLSKGQHVRLKPTTAHSKVWMPGAVEGQLDSRSYVVRTANNVLLRRNHVDIRATPEPNSSRSTPTAVHPASDQRPEPPAAPTNAEQSPATSPPVARRSQRARSRPAHLDDYVCD